MKNSKKKKQIYPLPIMSFINRKIQNIKNIYLVNFLLIINALFYLFLFACFWALPFIEINNAQIRLVFSIVWLISIITFLDMLLSSSKDIFLNRREKMQPNKKYYFSTIESIIIIIVFFLNLFLLFFFYYLKNYWYITVFQINYTLLWGLIYLAFFALLTLYKALTTVYMDLKDYLFLIILFLISVAFIILGVYIHIAFLYSGIAGLAITFLVLIFISLGKKSWHKFQPKIAFFIVLVILIGILIAVLINEIKDENFKNTILSIISALIGGSITFAGVLLTINNQEEKRQEEKRLNVKPFIYLFNSINIEYIEIENSSIEKPNIFFTSNIFKNSDISLAIIKGYYIDSIERFFKSEIIIEKNTVFKLKLNLYVESEYQEIGLIINDIYNNKYYYQITIENNNIISINKSELVKSNQV